MAKRISVELFLILAIGLVLGLFGPFGTFAAPTAPRILYWMAFALLGYLIFRPLIILGKWMSETLQVTPIICIGLALAIAAVPMTFLISLLLSGFDINNATQWKDWGQLYFQVWFIGLLINGLMHLLFARASDRAAPSIAAESVPEPRAATVTAAPIASTPTTFSDRLAPGFGSVLAIKSEDHYVRAIGAAREELVLLRLRDAIAELSALEGQQVHRSWWVAREAVSSVERDGRAVSLILTNGQEVPVAREKLSLLRKEGWLTQ
jgi:hypothetical protein